MFIVYNKLIHEILQMVKRRKSKAPASTRNMAGAKNWNKLRAELCNEVPKNDVSSSIIKSVDPVKCTKVKDKNKDIDGVCDQIIPLNSTNSQMIGSITQRLALDCEMVGLGPSGVESQLARVSIVNVHGETAYDQIVLPQENVTDYRSHITGLNKHIIASKGKPFKEVQKEVADLIQGKIIIGHDMKHDFDCLRFSHPKSLIRDTSKYKPFRAVSKGKTPSLKKLCQVILNYEIQNGTHDSVEDSIAALRLYKKHRAAWERSIKKHKKKFRENEVSDEINKI